MCATSQVLDLMHLVKYEDEKRTPPPPNLAQFIEEDCILD